MEKKYAVLSMDLEDWFHLDYFEKNQCDQRVSTLDGVDIYLDLLDEYSIKTTFFTVGELTNQLEPLLKKIQERGHEIGIHSHHHKRPLTLTLEEFREDTLKAKASVQKITENRPLGYRAPCFSLDRLRLDILKELDFSYDTSKIDFADHPLYGKMDINDFKQPYPWVFEQNGFVEFEVSTSKVLGKSFPVSGGGYVRILPWFLMKVLLKKYLKKNNFYFFYIHPFELSKVLDIPLPPNTSASTRFRFNKGRFSVDRKIRQLIELLNKEGYTITTFAHLKQELFK